jgi:mono/diheme cytochrome c family protein
MKDNGIFSVTFWGRALALGALGGAGCGTGTSGLEGPPGPPGAAGEAGVSVVVVNDAGVLVTPTPPLSARATQGIAISPVPMPIAGLPMEQAEQLGIGSYLVNAVCSCSDCHTPAGGGSDKFLAGGTGYAVDDGSVVYARNLTPDKQTGMTLTAMQFATVMTTGRDFNDKTGNSVLLVMAWSHFRWMTPADLAAIYAYLQAIPPVVNKVTADMKAASLLNGPPPPAPVQYDEGDVIRPLPPLVDAMGNPVNDPDAVMRGLAIRPLDAPTDLALDAMPADEQAQIGRGSYLANAAQCSDCHTNPPRLELQPGMPNYMQVNTADYLSGGRVFQVPPPIAAMNLQARTMSSDLTGDMNGFFNQSTDSFARFIAFLQSGTHVAAAASSKPPRALGWPMPWQDFRNMALDDLEALYTYLKALPPLTGPADKVTPGFARYCAAANDCNTGETCTANECAGAACAAASPYACGACQTCASSACAAPALTDPCVTQGI